MRTEQMPDDHIISRRQDVNRKLNESWMARESLAATMAASHMRSTRLNPTMAAASAVKGIQSWLKTTVKAPKTQPLPPRSNKIADEVAEELKQALVDRRVKTVLTRSLSLLVQDPSKTARLYQENQTASEICSDLIANEVVEERAFNLVDLGRIARNATTFRNVYPLLAPMISVAENADDVVLQQMALAGVGFTCRTGQEVVALNAALERIGLDFDEVRLRDANPCKARSHLNSLIRLGASEICVDSAAEVKRVAVAYSNAGRTEDLSKITLCVQLNALPCCCPVEAQGSVALPFCPACAEEELQAVVAAGRLLGMNRIDLALNMDGLPLLPVPMLDSILLPAAALVGMENTDTDTVQRALAATSAAALAVEAATGRVPAINFDGLPTGSSQSSEALAAFHALLAASLPRQARGGARLLTVEAGGVLLAGGSHLAARVQGSRRVPVPSAPSAAMEEDAYQATQYYLDDGCYGSLSGLLLDTDKDGRRRRPVISTTLDARGKPLPRTELAPATVWGPTCDGVDCVAKLATLPPSLGAGDWVVVEDVGAGRPRGRATDFNGLKTAEPVYCLHR
mmetsp:Transcript_3015/g.4958  ORF Transcript_3015/g.4958 Transcript_3015/m.4958 type:complete len:571 (-) Transcript_3015:107-1819(-)